jgi:uncharacterized membrane protein
VTYYITNKILTISIWKEFSFQLIQQFNIILYDPNILEK